MIRSASPNRVAARATQNRYLPWFLHLTPRGRFAPLYAASLTTGELEVRGDTDDVVFDYIVYGLRIGFEDYPVFRKRMAEAAIPPAGYHDQFYTERPGLRGHSALERYRAIEQAVHGWSVDAMPESVALRAAIGEREPGLDIGVGESIPQRERPDDPFESDPGERTVPTEVQIATDVAPSSDAVAARGNRGHGGARGRAAPPTLVPSAGERPGEHAGRNSAAGAWRRPGG